MTSISHKSILEMGSYSGLSLENISQDTVMSLYRSMLRLRRCEEALIEEYHPDDEMKCPVHFCVGQEAAPAALAALLKPEDYLFSHHRSHGYFLAKGAPMDPLFAELYGRSTGSNGGVAGSQDISFPSMRFYSGAILSGAVGMAVGSGLGIQLKGEPHVAVAGFGEGASDEGAFWEAINYAALRKLPVIFMCENNLYATYSHQLKRHPKDNLSERVAAFGVESHSLFGNDAPAVYRTVADAFQRARSGNGPTFIESYTYRWYGHVGPEDDDTQEYRPKAERDFWMDHCPIKLLESEMMSTGLLTSANKSAITEEIDREISSAFEFAKSSPFPELTSWEDLNYSPSSPMADRLLVEAPDANVEEFDESQADSIPGPY